MSTSPSPSPSLSRTELLQGTLDLLILKTLALGPMHGFGISQRIRQITRDVFRVNPGSFFPALYRLEQKGWVTGKWGESENKRRAKFYTLTKAGRKQLNRETRNWERVTTAISRVLEAT